MASKSIFLPSNSIFRKAFRCIPKFKRKSKKPIIVSRHNKDSPQLYFVYQGARQHLMMDPFSFLRKTGILKHNLVMLRDPTYSFYHGPISKDFPDFHALKEWQKNYKEKYPHNREIHCLGTSSGGYAAILFGYYLKVDTVTAFGAPTLIDLAAIRESYSLPDSWTLPETHRDLAKLLAHGNRKTKYRLYYCKDYYTDRAHAERLADCTGVSLHPQEGNIHNVGQILERCGQLEKLFPSVNITDI